jgi:indolepyruvate ferredoxin oxidoreductase
MDPRFFRTEGIEAYTGNELIVKGALEAGIDLITGYPGSPVADVLSVAGQLAPYLKEHGIVAQLANNEALAAARLNGSQLTDLNAMAVMKSVGLNVAADGLATGTLAKRPGQGGALIVVGDDPWNESTQVPQDSRRLSDHLIVPVIEPSNFQEVKDFVGLGLDLSRASGLYVNLVLTTNLADGGGTVLVKPNVSRRHRFEQIVTSKIPVDKTVLLPPHTSRSEQEAWREKVPRLHKRARELKIDKVEQATKGTFSEIGLVASGLSWSYLKEALQILGLENSFSIYRPGLTFPLDSESLLNFATGFKHIIVFEEKRGFVETQLQSIVATAVAKELLEFYPKIWGKNAPQGILPLPFAQGLNASIIAAFLEKLLTVICPDIKIKSTGFYEIEASAKGSQQTPLPLRTPSFCSGCPHRDSTTVFLEIKRDFKDPEYMKKRHNRAPEDLLFHGDSGCYSMLFLPPNQGLMHNYSGMGMGGGTGAGLAPFTRNKSVTFMGDGTFFHSGLIAISDAVKNNQDICFVILANGTTAMTGHQPHPGVDINLMAETTSAQDIEEVVKGIAVDKKIPIEKINPEDRKNYRSILEKNLLRSGVKIIIADKECGLTRLRKERRRKNELLKRDGFLKKEIRYSVAQDACEGCFECTVKTGCPGLVLKDSWLGLKVNTDLSLCVDDGACARLRACPAFELVTIERSQKASLGSLPDFRHLKAPQIPGFNKIWRAYIAGIGGMGIGSLTAVLVQAAKDSGYQVRFCDKKGMAVRNGGVFSHLAFLKEELDISPVTPYGRADLLIGLDILECARAADPLGYQKIAAPDRTVCVVNSAKNETILSRMGQDHINVEDLKKLLSLNTITEEFFSIELGEVCEKYLGDALYENTMMLGVLFQRGLLPLELKAILGAFEKQFSGMVKEKNTQAFQLGRDLVVNSSRYFEEEKFDLSKYLEEKEKRLKKSHGRKAAAVFRDSMQAALTRLELPAQWIARLAHFFYELVYYQDLNCAREYLKKIFVIAGRDSREKDFALTRALICNLFKVTAIKDEIYVAHLLTSREKYEQDLKRWKLVLENGDKIKYRHFTRPSFNVGGWVIEFDLMTSDWMLKIMKKVKFLRGWLSDWHRDEKDFRDWYFGLLEHIQTEPGNRYNDWVKVLSLPEKVRGYRQIRWQKQAQVRSEAASILSESRGESGNKSEKVKVK